MDLEMLPYSLSVCKLRKLTDHVPSGGFFFLANTGDEISLVCPAADVPEGAYVREDGWRAFRIAGTLEFSLVGILSRLSTTLAEKGIGLFAVSTYDTDYILVKERDLGMAEKALNDAGYRFK